LRQHVDPLEDTEIKPLGHSSRMERRGLEPLKPSGVRFTAGCNCHSANAPCSPPSRLSAKREDGKSAWLDSNQRSLPPRGSALAAGLQADKCFIYSLTLASVLCPRERAIPVEGFEPSVSTFKAWRSTVDLHWKTSAYSVRESNSRYALEGGEACH
jgi:hypothetical protein